jgi:hypothetical protein
MIFAREVSDSLTSLVKKLDEATAQNSKLKMGSFVVFCTDEDDLKDKLKSLAEKEDLKKIILTIDKPDGPPSYKFAKDADITVVLYNDRKVEANHTFKKGELNDKAVEAIMADVPKILVEKKKKEEKKEEKKEKNEDK